MLLIDFLATKISDEILLPPDNKTELRPWLRYLCRFGKDDAQSAFFSSREVSSVVELDVRRKLTHDILNWEFRDVDVDGIHSFVLNIDRNAELFANLQHHER